MQSIDISASLALACPSAGSSFSRRATQLFHPLRRRRDGRSRQRVQQNGGDGCKGTYLEEHPARIILVRHARHASSSDTVVIGRAVEPMSSGIGLPALFGRLPLDTPIALAPNLPSDLVCELAGVLRCKREKEMTTLIILRSRALCLRSNRDLLLRVGSSCRSCGRRSSSGGRCKVLHVAEPASKGAFAVIGDRRRRRRRRLCC